MEKRCLYCCNIIIGKNNKFCNQICYNNWQLKRTYDEKYSLEESLRLKEIHRKLFLKNDINRKCKKYIICDQCEKRVDARNFTKHKKWHDSGHDKLHKCFNPECEKMVGYRKKYCSNKCQLFFQTKQLEMYWKTIGTIKKESLRAFKNYLIKKYGNKCMVCGRTRWEKEKIPLCLDHIDGKHSNKNIDNFRLICHNCHAQTETFCGRNKNKRGVL